MSPYVKEIVDYLKADGFRRRRFPEYRCKSLCPSLNAIAALGTAERGTRVSLAVGIASPLANDFVKKLRGRFRDIQGPSDHAYPWAILGSRGLLSGSGEKCWRFPEDGVENMLRAYDTAGRAFLDGFKELDDLSHAFFAAAEDPQHTTWASPHAIWIMPVVFGQSRDRSSFDFLRNRWASAADQMPPSHPAFMEFVKAEFFPG